MNDRTGSVWNAKKSIDFAEGYQEVVMKRSPLRRMMRCEVGMTEFGGPEFFRLRRVIWATCRAYGQKHVLTAAERATIVDGFLAVFAREVSGSSTESGGA